MSVPSLSLEAKKYARRIKLSYCSDQEEGITRKRRGKGFAYYDAEGELITDPETKKRIQLLVIPPAWTDVWISSRPDTHIQVTGRDEKGRKQYVYHPDWESTRNLSKFEDLLEFGNALPAIRQRVEHDLRKRKLNHDKVVAIVTYMLDKTLIRIGNRKYATSNGSFGLTTLRKRHVKVDDAALSLDFVGKSGKKHQVSLTDKRLIRLVKSCQELPGQHLFQYMDEGGHRQTVQSTDVNDYLHEITNYDFSAKYFRTWGGTVAAIETLLTVGLATSDRERKRNVRTAIGEASSALGNTVSVCRAYYVHPTVIKFYENEKLFEIFQKEAEKYDPSTEDYAISEKVALSLLKK